MRKVECKKRMVCFAAAIMGVLQIGFTAFWTVQNSSAEPQSADIKYKLELFSGGLKNLRASFNAEQIALLEKINRRDLAHLVRPNALVIPLQWTGRELDYSPFPSRYTWAEKYPKALVVDLPSQAFGAYEYGRLVHWGPVSSGRKDRPTPSGLFHLTWRTRGRHSTVNREWYMPWYFGFDNKHGLSLHQYDLPGYPASHECIRLLESDARWLYDWGEEWQLDKKGWKVLKPGTPLFICGSYDHASQPPWRSLEWLAHGIRLPDDPLSLRSKQYRQMRVYGRG
ncbi:MAG TPA: L,D-transpeptidase [Syntrophales bacterium]|nr:L,D-transpeptidase [Syntrophales bacterium]